MLKKILVACSLATVLAAPAHAQVFDSFDSSSFGGSVGLSSGGISLNTGGGGVDVGATIGPGGISGGFGGDGFGGSFNNNGVSVGGDGFGASLGTNGGSFGGPLGIGGSFSSNGGMFSGPSINGSISGTGFQVGSNSSATNGTTSGGGGGLLPSAGATGAYGQSNTEGTHGYQTQETPAFATTTKNNQQSIVGPDLNLPPTTSKGLAPVFGY
jgi:hypothetical protein